MRDTQRTWNVDNATFNRIVVSFDNPDDVSIVIQNYRWLLSLAEAALFTLTATDPLPLQTPTEE
jgi:hypothetical protein